MYKKLLAVFLACFILFINVHRSYAEQAPTISISEKLPCISALLMEQESGKILEEKNIDQPLAPASLTKIMTMLLLFEAIDSGQIKLDDKISCSPNAKIMGGSEIWLEVGEQMSVHDIIKGLAVASANDCAVAVAEHLAGSEEEFVKRMNERAASLGMDGTQYKNAHGLDEEGHFTTARDVALVTREMMKHEGIKEYSTIWMDTLRDGKTELVNTNRLIRFYKGATGLKTGTTDNAGHCLSATASRDGLSLIAIVMGSPTGAERFDAASRLLDYGFANYINEPFPNLDELITPVKVIGGTEEYVLGDVDAPSKLLIHKKDKSAVQTKVELLPKLKAPIEKGQTLGTVQVSMGESFDETYNITAQNDIKRRSIFGSIMFLWGRFCNMK